MSVDPGDDRRPGSGLDVDLSGHDRGPTDGGSAPGPRRPPLLAMVVVGALMAAALLALFWSGRSVNDDLLDADESTQAAGTATFDLGAATVAGEVDTEWIRRERCPGWIQLNSAAGDATTLHVVATTAAPDANRGELVDVDDLPAWWASDIGVRFAAPTSTMLLDTPAVSGRLTADADAPEEALLVACEEASGAAGIGIRGPAAGFEQYAVATTEPVPGLGTVLVLGAAWVGGDIDLARDEAALLAETLRPVDG